MICDTDVDCTTLNLHDTLPQQKENIRTMHERIALSKNKTLP